MTFRQWLTFFVGTGPRFLASAFIVLVIVWVLNPDGASRVADHAIQTASATLEHMLQAMWPVLKGVAQVALMILGIRWIIAGPPRWLGGGRRGNRNN
jgi:hypothetical protein